jgi:hypothetical protein
MYECAVRIIPSKAAGFKRKTGRFASPRSMLTHIRHDRTFQVCTISTTGSTLKSVASLAALWDARRRPVPAVRETGSRTAGTQQTRIHRRSGSQVHCVYPRQVRLVHPCQFAICRPELASDPLGHDKIVGVMGSRQRKAPRQRERTVVQVEIGVQVHRQGKRRPASSTRICARA